MFNITKTNIYNDRYTCKKSLKINIYKTEVLVRNDIIFTER